MAQPLLHPAAALRPAPGRDAQVLLDRTLSEWGGRSDPWVFAYGSLIWNPGFDYLERRSARVHGWHRALRMWSRINRGTPERPGLVFGMLPGGSCLGFAYRIPREQGREVLGSLWQREMILAVYDPRWLVCHTPQGPVAGLAFTLSRRSPSHTGELTEAQYRSIFREARGKYGTTLDYARRTHEELQRHQIRDRQLERLLRLAQDPPPL